MLSERELESRYEVFVEQYVTTLNIEAETAAVDRPHDAPAGGDPVIAGSTTPSDRKGAAAAAIDELGGLLDEFVEAIFALEAANRDHPEGAEDILDEAKYVRDHGAPRRWTPPARSPTSSSGSCRRPLAAAEVLGDPLHQARSTGAGCRCLREGSRSSPSESDGWPTSG